jgi:hypothetical protein
MATGMINEIIAVTSMTKAAGIEAEIEGIDVTSAPPVKKTMGP